MNGPDHYRKAEEYLDKSIKDGPRGVWGGYYLKAAAVHAKLAEVAVLANSMGPVTSEQLKLRDIWTEVLQG